MLKQLRPAIASLILLSAVTGIAYPLAVTAIAQVAFHDQANGSLVRDEQGNVRGSALIAQKFDGAQVVPFAALGRRLATVSSGASNLAPGNPGAGRTHA
ncbi:potassium-transporting ATPase subunit C, partial [Pseudomonas sp. ATCC 13867]